MGAGAATLAGAGKALAAGGTAVEAFGEQADSASPLTATRKNLPLQRSNAM
jgi:hypothetical protein